MNESKNLTVAMWLEGSPTERGHVLLDDFLRQLKALEDALASVDREINGRATLDYRVVDLKHSSPATVRIEPVLKEQFRRAGVRTKFRNSVEQVHHRFFHDLGIIRQREERPPDTREETFDALRQLVDGLGAGFYHGGIENDRSNIIPLDEKLYTAFEKLSRPAFKSAGTVVGDLLTISFARGSKFYIYPQVGPTSIACHFNDDLSKKAEANIRKRVRVRGQKYFRPSSGLPFRIDVDEIEPLRLPKTFVTFGAKRRIYKGDPADIQIGRNRNEWA